MNIKIKNLLANLLVVCILGFITGEVGSKLGMPGWIVLPFAFFLGWFWKTCEFFKEKEGVTE